MIVLGIDPGGRETGCVVLDGDAPVWHDVLERADDESMHDYAHGVGALMRTMVRSSDVELVCIEGLVSVVPHVRDRPINPTGLLQAAVTFGACYALIRDQALSVALEVVRPDKFGSAPLQTYPDSLIGPRETKGTGRLRHARSAYDVALAGRRQHRHPQLHRGDTL